MVKILKSSGAVLLVAALLGCHNPGADTSAPAAAKPAESARQVFQVNGVIKEIKIDGRTAVIQHEEIPGYMPAMTMPLKTKGTNELTQLRAGDAVSFRMVVTADEGWIEAVTKTGEATVNQSVSLESLRLVRDVELLKVGDLMPEYHFTNELGQPIRLGDFKGQALAFTFIFTRCPFPDFCPRLSGNFAAAYRELTARPGAATNWHLLSLSFDPEHDTPDVLQAYARRYQYDPRRWSFASGALLEIDAITEQFGLGFSRAGASFNHNLRTVVLDAHGRVQKIFIGNDWKSEELVAELLQAAAN